MSINEKKWIDEVNHLYSTNHTSKLLDIENVDKEIYNVTDSFDEPYSDPSIVPSFVLANLMSNKFSSNFLVMGETNCQVVTLGQY